LPPFCRRQLTRQKPAQTIIFVGKESEYLKWYCSVQEETPDVYRGFCQECASSRFWDPRGKQHISISAGSIDPPTGLREERDVWVSQKGDYYDLNDDLPRNEERFSRADNEHCGKPQ
jgi:hypothetical protein